MRQVFELACIESAREMSLTKMQVYNSAFRNRYGTYTFEDAVTDSTEWGRQVESAVGAHLANRSLLDGFELLYWRNDKKEECDYVLKKGQALVAIEVKSSSAEKAKTDAMDAMEKARGE